MNVVSELDVGRNGFWQGKIADLKFLFCYATLSITVQPPRQKTTAHIMVNQSRLSYDPPGRSFMNQTITTTETLKKEERKKKINYLWSHFDEKQQCLYRGMQINFIPSAHNKCGQLHKSLSHFRLTIRHRNKKRSLSPFCRLDIIPEDCD